MQILGLQKLLWTLGTSGSKASILLLFGGPERPFTGLLKLELLKKR